MRKRCSLPQRIEYNFDDKMKMTASTFNSTPCNSFSVDAFGKSRPATTTVRIKRVAMKARSSTALQLQRVAVQLVPRKQKVHQFLQRGASVNRAVILNVLRSKVAPQIVGTLESYTSVPQNQELVHKIKGQIPLGLRDVVGVEQMIRMSQIFTGRLFKSINLYSLINCCNEESQQEESIPLKSVKRW